MIKYYLKFIFFFFILVYSIESLCEDSYLDLALIFDSL